MPDVHRLIGWLRDEVAALAPPAAEPSERGEPGELAEPAEPAETAPVQADQ
jgi:hypothetical protein